MKLVKHGFQNSVRRYVQEKMYMSISLMIVDVNRLNKILANQTQCIKKKKSHSGEVSPSNVKKCIKKSIYVLHLIIKIKDKHHIINSTDAEKSHWIMFSRKFITKTLSFK